ncbi:OLC1v1030613C2 [Oldenlandia corymbosa var. corymbosa]|uniref:OLC1v1030613C2 n=1 Tax=Oldenlandia corymbosa var. corymbosa TaxID=529605 RepID=A0AAV1CJF1_OLDCO|nr:OLC1v1030613C2 [Oldenlandia corymbosa var. corymbosa]
MQEAGGSGSEQIDGMSDIQIEKRVSDVGTMMEDKEVETEGVCNNQSAEVSSSSMIADVEKAPERHVTSEPLQAAEELYVASAGQQGDQIHDVYFPSSEDARAEKGCEKDDVESSLVYEIEDIPKSLGNNMLKLPFGPNPSSISLAQLAEMIKGLEKDEFRFVCCLRESPAENLRGSSCLNPPEVSILENIKEQLYLTSLAKDANELQLYDQLGMEMQMHSQIQKLVDELSMISASFSDAQGKNEILSKELAECRSELQELSFGKEVLQKQLQNSKAELEEFKVKVDDLENELKMSREELAQTSSELADGRNSLSDLQVQNESLNSRIALLMEEKMAIVKNGECLLQENEKMSTELANCKALTASAQSEHVNLTENLASLEEENRNLVEEKERLVQENGKLSLDLTDRNAMVQALQAEISELSEIIVVAKEDNKKLADAQVNFPLVNEKLALELANSQISLETLQAEMSSLHGIVSSLTNERNKLADEKQYLLSQNENGSHELVESKSVLAGSQADLTKATGQLQQASSAIEQLIQENVLLKTNLELHIAEISNCEGALNAVKQFGGLKVADIDSSSRVSSTDDSETASLRTQKTLGTDDAVQFGKLVKDDFDDPFGFESWKMQLNEGSNVLQEIDNAVDDMQSLSASLCRSSSKQAAPGVSKLIQAFETKSHTDDSEITKLNQSENPPSEDPYILAKKQIKKLQLVFKEIFLQAINACAFLEGERKNRLATEVLNAELKDFCSFWENHGNNLEAENIELVFLCEALKQHVCESEVNLKELVVSYNNLQKKDSSLNAENNQLAVKLRNFDDTIAELHTHLDEIRRHSKQMVFSISDSVENLEKEVGDVGLTLEGDWKTFSTETIQEVRKLNSSIQTISSVTLSANEGNAHRISSVITASIDFATQVIDSLQRQLWTTLSDHHSLFSKYTEMHKNFHDLQGNNGILVDVLGKTYMKTVGTESLVENDKLLDPLDPGVLHALLEKLPELLDERLQLLSDNDILKSDMKNLVRDNDELRKRCLHLDAIMKMFNTISEELILDSVKINPIDPLPGLEAFVSILTQKLNETAEQHKLSKENLVMKEVQFSALHGELDHLSLLLVQYENENLVLKESWRTSIKDVSALQAELLEKVSELEQSELRVSSLREKLGIAVSKGKGLIVQRDSLKQSLTETSSQLEKCSQELQLKDGRIYELEAKLKTYSEAGERMEALKSELAYIRNSATALRESFLLKDSVLQRIEEILEDLELPENFHSSDIIDKVHWLAKSITGNTSVVDWDQKSSVGGSYSESGFAVADGWKEETQPNQDLTDDLKRKFEELQGKFYGLAEHNDMLEQSLIERNQLVQRWEEILGKIEVPSQLSSLEPENKIQWLGRALSDTQSHCSSLQQRIDYLDSLSGSLTGDLEESKVRISELESAYHSVIVEKEVLLKKLETLNNDFGEFSKKASFLETENENLLKEKISLRKELDQKLVDEEHAQYHDGKITRLHGLIREVLQESVADVPDFASDSVENLEHLVENLIEKYQALLAVEQVDPVDLHQDKNARLPLSEEKTKDSGDGEDILALNKRLEDAIAEINYLKEERDNYFNSNVSFVREIEALDAKKLELQELLNHEEQKSASLREKLNIAVKKGKSLVQQRDNMKQVIDEANAEVDRLKSAATLRENAIVDYEQKVENLTMSLERLKVTEGECAYLRDSLSDTERRLEEKEHSLALIIDCFKDFQVDLGSGNPFETLQAFGKSYQNLLVALECSEQESRKSKRAAELLLAELNEVQERNDALQEELVNVGNELSELSREKELFEAEKSEALLHLEKLSADRLEERDHLLSEVLTLRSSVHQLQMEISAIDSSLADVLFEDLEILRNLNACLQACLETTNDSITSTMPAAGVFSALNNPKLENKMFMTEVGSLKDRLQRHYSSRHEEASHIYETLRTVFTEVVSLKESLGPKDNELVVLKSVVNDKDSELLLMQRNVALLYEACNISIGEIENFNSRKSEIHFPDELPHRHLNAQTIVWKDASMPETGRLLEENVINVRDRLLSMLRDLFSKQNAILEDGQKEMKALILNLQKELHEKDIQRERICSEFADQIKEAKAEAMAHLQDLRSARTQANDLQVQLSVNQEEHAKLGRRIKELEDQEAMCVELTRRVSSLSDALAAKDQEIEALMQALDEEESQMEGLSNKILELEKELQKKNQDLEKVDASRGKALKKLSVTVSKFDELHNLSETLLSEVENLQSQLQDRDQEISFLRQEVTRCTNETLSATQMSNKRHTDEVLEVLTLLDGLVSQFQVPDMSPVDVEANQVKNYEVKLQKKISFILSELEKLQAAVQDRDLLLGVERNRVEGLMQKELTLENLLLEKESQLAILRRLAESGQETSSSSEIMEVDPLINKRAAPGTVAPQVRGGRKINSDHVAIAIDRDPPSPMEDDDDDKAHGFKSLTTSAFVPRFTRPVSDVVDGLWMSCDRTLMRQPTLRLGVIIYWAIIHTLLAAIVV